MTRLLAAENPEHRSTYLWRLQDGAGIGPQGSGDQYSRVHGLEGLRVADASVMPHVIRANTNATTIMFGERAADWTR
jgi:choline dehydrogenase